MNRDKQERGIVCRPLALYPPVYPGSIHGNVSRETFFKKCIDR